MADSALDHPKDQLTDREWEILGLMAEGLTNREIGKRLFLALETVRWYTKRIYSKLQVKNRTQAAGVAKGLHFPNHLGEGQMEATFPGLPKHNLTAQWTAFVGRGSELDELARLLQDRSTRLVTILAPGGTGKSRLAMQIGKGSLAYFPDGIFFIPLEHISSEGSIAARIFEKLEIQPSGSRPVAEDLTAYLRNKRILLVLDGFEQAPVMKSLVLQMLETTKELKILATSRTKIELQGEMVYRLRGLDMPNTDQAEDILQSGAIKLFVQAARNARPDVNFSEVDLAHMVEICQFVEGMPLGILMAGAWMEMLSPQEIIQELHNNLNLLQTHNQDVPIRQQSLQTVFEYSMGLLEETEKNLYCRLSVFRGYFSREAAGVIAGAGLDDLARLVGKSLVEYEPALKRYRLHSLMRQYAYQMLETQGLDSDVNNQHLSYYAETLNALWRGIRGGNQSEALERFREDWENIRAAWLWAIRQGEPSFIERSLESMYWLCVLSGRVMEGDQLFQQARTEFFGSGRGEPAPYPSRLVLRFDASGDDYRTQLEREIEHARRQDDRAYLGFLLWAHGVNAYTSQDFSRAIESLDESLGIYEQNRDEFYQIEIQHLLWICHRFFGDHHAAEEFLEGSINLGRKTGNQFAVARALGSGGAIDFLAGNYQKAWEATQEALQIRREMGDRGGEAMSLAMSAWLKSIEGATDQARELAETSLKLSSDAHNLNSKMTAMNALGWLACLSNEYQEAYALSRKSLRNAPDPTVSVSAELVLSYAQYGLGRNLASMRLLRKVLTFSRTLGARGLYMLCLPLIALHMELAGEWMGAFEAAAYIKAWKSNELGWLEKMEEISERLAALGNGPNESRGDFPEEPAARRELDEIVRDFLQS